MDIFIVFLFMAELSQDVCEQFENIWRNGQ